MASTVPGRVARALCAATAGTAVTLSALAGLAGPALAATGGELVAGPTSQVVTSGHYTLGGYLTDNGVPVVGDTVTLYRDTGHGLARLGVTRTQARGWWAFAEYTPGSIVLRAMASADGLMPAVWSQAAVVHVRQSSLGQQAVRRAAALAGDPYQYGAAGPHAFDCSGLTSYVFGELGYHLPRTAEEQYQAVRHLPQSDLAMGDLVFFGRPGDIYHVGIYAGDGQIWHSPRPGQTVREDPIWTSDYEVGQVG